jgi:ElaB/YqjD/DUF883 family membrane-anchored ribosome-binding protein
MTGRSLDTELKRLRSDFVTLQEDMADIAGLMRELAGTRATAARETAAGSLRTGSERLSRGLHAANARRRQAVGQAEETIAVHPFLSLFIAFGVGFLAAVAGGLMRRE